MKKYRPLNCGMRHLAALRRELAENGLCLKSSSSQSQHDMLLRVLKYLGGRGLNTIEGQNLGFLRLATRVHELLNEGYIIPASREAIIGTDGLVHVGIARYHLVGRREGGDPQLSLSLA